MLWLMDYYSFSLSLTADASAENSTPSSYKYLCSGWYSRSNSTKNWTIGRWKMLCVGLWSVPCKNSSSFFEVLLRLRFDDIVKAYCEILVSSQKPHQQLRFNTRYIYAWGLSALIPKGSFCFLPFIYCLDQNRASFRLIIVSSRSLRLMLVIPDQLCTGFVSHPSIFCGFNIPFWSFRWLDWMETPQPDLPEICLNDAVYMLEYSLSVTSVATWARISRSLVILFNMVPIMQRYFSCFTSQSMALDMSFWYFLQTIAAFYLYLCFGYLIIVAFHLFLIYLYYKNNKHFSWN